MRHRAAAARRCWRAYCDSPGRTPSLVRASAVSNRSGRVGTAMTVSSLVRAEAVDRFVVRSAVVEVLDAREERLRAHHLKHRRVVRRAMPKARVVRANAGARDGFLNLALAIDPPGRQIRPVADHPELAVLPLEEAQIAVPFPGAELKIERLRLPEGLDIGLRDAGVVE